MPSIPRETSFEVVIPYKTEDEANFARTVLLAAGIKRFERAEVREVAK